MDDRGVGWIMYAWLCLVIVGVWNIFEGILAIGRSHFYTSTGAHYVISDLRTWGWIVTIWGVIELLAAASVWRGAQFGRWFGIVVAGVGIIVQFFWFPLYPFWALTLMFLYFLVLYGLAAYGGTHERVSG
jgi:hypothetical protein